MSADRMAEIRARAEVAVAREDHRRRAGPVRRGRPVSAPIERAAEALYTPRWDSHGHPTWADVDHGVKEEYRKDASAALTAALDVDELAQEVGKHSPTDHGRCVCGWQHDWSEQHFRGWIAAYDEHVARAIRTHLLGDENDE